jgi:D-serine deaminase-like pyridoxal phosphate-dependent protein
MREDEIDTPALIVELDAFESNLRRMADLLAPTGAKLRAHAKTHKSPVIAHLQIKHGAVGQCVQKVAEAEILAWSGVPSILVTNEIVGGTKLARLASLARLTDVTVCADHADNVRALEDAAASAGRRLSVLVEIDVGGQRCGVSSGEEAVHLARLIARSPHLIFGGLQAYHARAQHERCARERAASARAACELTSRTVDLLRDSGLSCRIVGGAGTGTLIPDATSGVYTEIQAGSFCFMDADYARNRDDAGQSFRLFEHSLFVLTTVMSTPRSGRAVVDAGHKAVATDSGMPLVWQRPGLCYARASDEHGTLEHDIDTIAPTLGEKLRLVPGHCDPTVDRYDWYVGVRNQRVECIWPISMRGAMY